MHVNCLNDLRNVNAEVFRLGSFASNFRDQKLYIKYSQTKEEYDLDTYPPYCAGACQTFTAEYAKRIYMMAKITNPGIFLHDDVFFSGVLREKGDIFKSLPICLRFLDHLDIPNKIRGICHYGTGKESIIELEGILENIVKHHS